jgi:hypothetical protein
VPAIAVGKWVNGYQAMVKATTDLVGRVCLVFDPVCNVSKQIV